MKTYFFDSVVFKQQPTKKLNNKQFLVLNSCALRSVRFDCAEFLTPTNNNLTTIVVECRLVIICVKLLTTMDNGYQYDNGKLYQLIIIELYMYICMCTMVATDH